MLLSQAWQVEHVDRLEFFGAGGMEGAAMTAAAVACKCGEVAVVVLSNGAPCLPSSVMVLLARVAPRREAPGFWVAAY